MMGGTPRSAIQTQEEDELWRITSPGISIADEGGDLEVPRGLLLGYTK
jgi:hypothetical protein